MKWKELSSLVGLDGAVEVLQTTQSFFETLRAFLGERGIELAKVAYTRDGFAELLGDKLDPEHLEGVDFPMGCGRKAAI